MSDLNDSDLAMLRPCPFSQAVMKDGRNRRDIARKLERISSLQRAGFISGKITTSDHLMHMFSITLRAKGYRAIGRSVPEGVS